MLLFVLVPDVDNYLCARIFGLTIHWSYFCTSATISSCFKFTPWYWGKQSSLLPSAESGAWPDCLSVVNEACLKNKPRGASIPRTSPAHHKKRSQGTSSSLVSYFSPYCSLMWDIRALQRRPGEPIPTLAESAVLLCCRLACITHAYRRLIGQGNTSEALSDSVRETRDST